MKFKDYYHILGVGADADNKSIKTAYRKLARKYHPDVSKYHDAEERFKEAAEAYEVLKDPEKRAEYDTLRQYGSREQYFKPPPDWQSTNAYHSGNHTQSNRDFSDFFSAMFGSGNTHSARHDNGRTLRGRDVEIDMPIFLEDTLNEAHKPLSYSLNGENKTLNVKIPAGVTNGEPIRLKGQGEAGNGGAPNGDLYLRIRLVPHPLFDVEYHDLIIAIPLAPWEAALGTKVQLPTLTGKIQLTIPANSQAGQRLRIRGQGLAYKAGRGNLYAVLKIVMPKTADQMAKQHWQQLSEQVHFNPRSEWGKYL